VQEFRSHALVKKHLGTTTGQNGVDKRMAVSSNYFLLSAAAQYGRAEIHLASVIARDKDGTLIIRHGQGEY
jgi:type II secretory pathway component PulK